MKPHEQVVVLRELLGADDTPGATEIANALFFFLERVRRERSHWEHWARFFRFAASRGGLNALAATHFRGPVERIFVTKVFPPGQWLKTDPIDANTLICSTAEAEQAHQRWPDAESNAPRAEVSA